MEDCIYVAVEAEVVGWCQGSLRSSCQIANGHIVMRDALSVSQKETM